MRFILLGEPNPDSDPPSPELIAQLAQDVYACDLLKLLVSNLWRCEFEARKDVVAIFNSLLRRQIGTRWPTVDYLGAREEVIFATLQGCVAINHQL